MIGLFFDRCGIQQLGGKENTGLLNERIETLEGENSSIQYTIDVVALKKPKEKLIEDASNAVKLFKEGFVDPVVTSFLDVSHYTGR